MVFPSALTGRFLIHNRCCVSFLLKRAMRCWREKRRRRSSRRRSTCLSQPSGGSSATRRARPTAGTDVLSSPDGILLLTPGLCGLASGPQMERSGTGTKTPVSVASTSLLLLLQGDGNRGEVLGSPSHHLGCRASCLTFCSVSVHRLRSTRILGFSGYDFEFFSRHSACTELLAQFLSFS